MATKCDSFANNSVVYNEDKQKCNNLENILDGNSNK